jgi:hypothetical protein
MQAHRKVLAILDPIRSLKAEARDQPPRLN